MKRFSAILVAIFYFSILPSLAVNAAAPVIGNLVVKSSPYVDVRAYGAVSDDGVSDVAAMRLAVAAVAASGGGKVLVPPGVWQLDIDDLIDLDGTHKAVIQISDNNITVEGAGDSSVIYIPTWATYIGGSPSIQGFFVAASFSKNISNIHFRNFKVLSNYPQSDTTIPKTNADTSAIHLGMHGATYSISNSGVSNVTFEKTGMGIQFNGGGVPSPPCDRNYATNNIFYNISSGAINAISGAHTNTLIANNIFSKIGGMGIEWASYRTNIVNNIFDNVQGGAIVTETNSAATGYSMISNNIINYAGNYGGFSGTTSSPAVQFSEGGGGHQMMIVNNIIHNAYGSGIYLAANSDNVVIQGNTIDGFGIDGVTRTPGVGDNFYGINAVNMENIKVINNHVTAATGANDNSAYGIAVGGGLSVYNFSDHNSTTGTFNVKAFQLPVSVGTAGTGSNTWIGRNNVDLTAMKVAPPLDNTNAEYIPSFAAGDTTPSVAGSNIWSVTNGSPTSISALDDGYTGQVVSILFYDNNSTLVNGSGLALQGATNFSSTASDVVTLMRSNTDAWYEVSRSVN